MDVNRDMDPSRSGPDKATVQPVEKQHLRGDLTVPQLVFTILAYNGPLAIVLGFATVVIGYGNGLGAPAAFVAAPVIVGLFAVGFTRMVRSVPRPGGFYSYVTAGLGREVGLGTAFLAVLFYYLVLVGNYSFVGVLLETLVSDTLNGPDVSWWVWAIVVQGATAVLGYVNLEFSARVFRVLLIAEVVVIVVYDACVVFKGGEAGLGTSSLDPANIFSGSYGLALLFGMLCMGGFEATAIFRDEVRDPDRTIPRAAYAFIAIVGVMFAFSTWVVIQALGEKEAVATAGADPAGAFLGTVETFVGRAGVDIANVLVVTSLFAAALATHNILARYLFNLGTDRIFPAWLGEVHKRQGSPYKASMTTSLIAFFGFAVLVAGGAAPELLYAQVLGGSGYAFLLLLLITNIAIVVYLRREVPETSAWVLWGAPALAGGGLIATLWIATSNIEVLITAGGWVVNLLLAAIFGSVVLGILVAMALKRMRPDTYRRIGRQ